MARVLKRILVFSGTVSIMIAATGIHAQPQPERAVEQFSCKEVMHETGADRDVAIAFLHGYLLGKSGSSKFNLDVLRKQTDDFVDRCLNNPTEKALDSMISVKK